jgi:hypothetical protein
MLIVAMDIEVEQSAGDMIGGLYAGTEGDDEDHDQGRGPLKLCENNRKGESRLLARWPTLTSYTRLNQSKV